MTFFAEFSSPWGMALARSEGEALGGLFLRGQKRFAEIAADWRRDENLSLFGELREELFAYAEGNLRAFDLPLAIEGTPFQIDVRRALLSVPFGKSISYRELAVLSGHAGCCRAVGAAVGGNPLLLVVPCHRVLGSDGSLRGFAAGIELKRKLLAFERRILEEERRALPQERKRRIRQ